MTTVSSTSRSTRSEKRDFFNDEVSLSIADLDTRSTEDFDTPVGKVPPVRRGKVILPRADSTGAALVVYTEDDYKFEMDVGDSTDLPSILRIQNTEERNHKRLSWGDTTNGELKEVFHYEAEEEDETAKMEVEDEEEEEEDLALVIDQSDDDEDHELIIDEGGDDDVKVERKGRKSKDQIKKEKEVLSQEKAELLKKVAEIEDTDEQFELLIQISELDRKMRNEAPLKLVKKDKQPVVLPDISTVDVMKMERDAYEKWSNDVLSIDNTQKNEVFNDDASNSEEFVEKTKSDPMVVENMPDLENLMLEVESMVRIDREMEEKRKKEEEEEDKKDKKKASKTIHSHTKKKEEHKVEREMTEEEVIAEIEKKKIVASEKAEKMKIMKMEQKIKREEEKERKKKEKEKKVEEKNKMRIDDDGEKDRKRKAEQSLIDIIPKSRAQKARITKALLKLGIDTEEEREEDEEEEDGEPKRKRRKSTRRRTKQVMYSRKTKREEECDDGVGVGSYIMNPCDAVTEEACVSDCEEDEESDPMENGPCLWTSEQDRLLIGAAGPINFDPDEVIKRQLNGSVQFSQAISDKYVKMIGKLDGMKTNLYGDHTLQRFHSNLLHNVDSRSTPSTWPADLFNEEGGLDQPQYQYQMWNRPFRGLIRLRPIHKAKDQIVCEALDYTAGKVPVTKKDLVKNLEDLVMSKLKKTKWAPLPNSRNPYDIPESSTRNMPSVEKRDYRNVTYVTKVEVASIPSEMGKKKKRKTRKEVLMEMIVEKPMKKEINEDIYKNEEEYDGRDGGYEYAWDEMGEMIQNPMRDDHMEGGGGGNDDFYINRIYDDVDYHRDDENVMMEEGGYNDEYEREEEGTQLGEALEILGMCE